VELLISNQKLPFNIVTFRDMGFGKEICQEDKLEYLFDLSLSEFSQVAEKLFDDFVNECKQDDEISVVETLGIRELGYPTFRQVLHNNRDVLVSIIKEYLPLEFLYGYFNNKNKTEWKYAINSIDEIILNDNNVTIRGSAYQILWSIK